MADLAPQGVTDFGNLMSSYPRGMAQANEANSAAGVNQQQAAGMAIANQKAALGLQLYKQALNNFEGQEQAGSAAPDQSGAAGAADQGDQGGDQDAGDTQPFNPQAIDVGLRNRFFVDPKGTPQEQRGLAMAALSGDQGLLQYATTIRDNGVVSRTAANQRDANSLYDVMGSVADPDNANPFATLARIAPQTAKAIQARVGDDPAALNSAAAAYAAHVGASVHQYTGREAVADTAGVYRDKVTGQPVLGVPKTGLSEQQWADLATKGSAPTKKQDSAGHTIDMTQWQYDGAPNLGAWVMRMAARGGVQPTPAAKTAATAAASTQPAASLPKVSDPVLRAALADTSWRLPQQKTVVGVSQSDNEKNAGQVPIDQTKQLKADMGSLTSSSAQSMLYLQAAKAVLNSPGHAPTGLSAPLQTIISRAWSVVGGGGSWAAKQQEMAKYLGNAAVQTFRQNFGARPAAQEFVIQMRDLNPSGNMEPSALNDLIDTNIAVAKYGISTAQRMIPYLAAKNDPGEFAQWNQKYFPREDIVTQSKAQGQQKTQTQQAANSPPISTLKEGHNTTFKNGQVWTLKGGKAVKVSG